MTQMTASPTATANMLTPSDGCSSQRPSWSSSEVKGTSGTHTICKLCRSQDWRHRANGAVLEITPDVMRITGSAVARSFACGSVPVTGHLWR